MSALRRVISATAATAAVSLLLAPSELTPPAAADPCSVPTGPAARSLTPNFPQLPLLHLPIGRKPAFLNGDTSAAARQEAATADAAVAPDTPPAAAEAPEAETATIVDWITGPNSTSYTRFGISGTDLGIMWDNGSATEPQVLIAFGDTFGDCGVPGQEWRKNALFRSSDRNLADGMTIPDPRYGDVYAGSPSPGSGPTSPGR